MGKRGEVPGVWQGDFSLSLFPQLREGATVVLSPHILSAEDEDSPAEEVTYSIQPPANGKVVLRSAPGTELQRFTQAQIDNGLVLFVHQGRAGLRCPRPLHHPRVMGTLCHHGACQPPHPKKPLTG